MNKDKYLLKAKQGGRFIVVRCDDSEQPLGFESMGQVTAQWNVKDIENAVYLREHPAAIVAAGFHGAKADGFDLAVIFSIEELRAAMACADAS